MIDPMCTSSNCIVSEKCHRHEDSGTAPRRQQRWQSFYPEMGVSCTGFLQIKTRGEDVRSDN